MIRESARLLARRFLSGRIPKATPRSLLCSARDFSFSSTPFPPHNPSSFAPLNPWKPPNSTPWFKFGGQKRSMFIQTQSTPNPMSVMFYPGKPVMEVGSADFPNARAAMNSPLAKSLFGIDGITRVFFGSDFVTVTKSEEASWDFLKPEIFAAIMDFYSSAKPLFLDSDLAASMDTAIHEVMNYTEKSVPTDAKSSVRASFFKSYVATTISVSKDDSEIVAMIKELLETRIRPAVQDDGGDIEYRGFDPDTGVVKLKMQGACSGCPSSSVTLKSGIENMLMHYVPEVRGVEQELDNGDEDTLLNSQMD